MSVAYYNENDPKAAAWLEELIKGGHIASGVVDTRSIEDVTPEDVRGFTQCHFFAGIGGWSYALRLAGWPDDRPVWTGSCPCQPFSAAGKGGGTADERHLWPTLFHLVQQLSPTVLFGEQVASKAGLAWLDIVRTDLEDAHYAVGAADLCAAGVGAPHIRQRLYWLADRAEPGRSARREGVPCGWREEEPNGCAVGDASDAGLPERLGLGGVPGGPVGTDTREAFERAGVHFIPLADDGSEGRLQVGADFGGSGEGSGPQGLEQRLVYGGAWSDADWLPCRDGKARPVEPGTFPLAHGVPGRVGLLRGYGNAIVSQVAAAFIEAYLE